MSRKVVAGIPLIAAVLGLAVSVIALAHEPHASDTAGSFVGWWVEASLWLWVRLVFEVGPGLLIAAFVLAFVGPTRRLALRLGLWGVGLFAGSVLALWLVSEASTTAEWLLVLVGAEGALAGGIAFEFWLHRHRTQRRCLECRERASKSASVCPNCRARLNVPLTPAGFGDQPGAEQLLGVRPSVLKRHRGLVDTLHATKRHELAGWIARCNGADDLRRVREMLMAIGEEQVAMAVAALIRVYDLGGKPSGRTAELDFRMEEMRQQARLGYKLSRRVEKTLRRIPWLDRRMDFGTVVLWFVAPDPDADGPGGTALPTAPGA